MIGTFGFQVFRGAPTFQSFNFSRSSKDALAHTKDASIGVCLSKLSGADAQSKPVRPEDYYNVLFEFGSWQNEGMMRSKTKHESILAQTYVLVHGKFLPFFIIRPSLTSKTLFMYAKCGLFAGGRLSTSAWV